MFNLSGGSLIAMTVAAGAVVVGGAAWFEFGRDVPAIQSDDATLAALPAGDEEVQNPQPKPTNETSQDTLTPPVDDASDESPAKAEPTPTQETPQEAVAPKEVEASEEVTAQPEEPKTAQIAPAFDEVRREEDGMTIIAGSAAPGSQVEILQDGTVIATAPADGGGKFATIVMIPPDGKGHILSLQQIIEGEAVASADQIILAPLAPPVQIAEATPEEAATSQPTPEAPSDTAQAPAVPSNTPEPGQEIDAAAPAETAAAPQTPDTTTDTAEAPASADAPTQPAVVAQTQTPQEDAEPTVQAEAATNAPASAQPAESAATTEEATPAPTAEPTTTAQSAPAAPATPEAEPAQPQTAETEPAPQQPAPAPQTAQTQETAAPTKEVAVLKTSDDGVELINTPSPEVMDNVALDTISYSDEGDVQLSGRAQSEARSVRVYLNNNAVVSLAVDDKGRWRGDLPDVDEGIYTLRVDEVAEDGSVTSRVETPFKREDPEVLAEAAATQDGPLKQITVQKGATLWAIAQERYGDGLLYVNVFQANAETIRDPDLIYPGQIFALPEN